MMLFGRAGDRVCVWSGAIRVVTATAVLSITSACQSSNSPAAQPARLVEPSAATRAELARAVAGALEREEVTLDDDALTDGSTLVVARRLHRDAQQRVISGRDLESPEHFHLHLVGEDCVLTHVGSDRQWILRTATCAPE